MLIVATPGRLALAPPPSGINRMSTSGSRLFDEKRVNANANGAMRKIVVGTTMTAESTNIGKSGGTTMKSITAARVTTTKPAWENP